MQVQQNDFIMLRHARSNPYMIPGPPRFRGEARARDWRLNPYAVACPASCGCSCHAQSQVRAPAFMNRFLGRFFVSAAGIPLLGRKCSFKKCQSFTARNVSIEYWLPSRMFQSQMVRLELGTYGSLRPELSLRSLRRVPDSAKCVLYAKDGNIEGLKDLFQRGLASPWDVSSTRGYTLARVSQTEH